MPRPIEPILDDVFYTYYRAPKFAVDEEDDPNTETTKSEDQKIEEQSDEDHKIGRFYNLDNFGDKKAEPFGSDNDDVDDDVDEFLQGGDKERGGGTGGYNDPSEKKSRRAGIDPSNITQPNYYFVESASGQTYTDTADLNGAIDLADKLAVMKGEDFKVISQRGTEYHTGAGRTFGSRRADTREQMELGLRGDCEACVGTGELYAGEPCPVCHGTGNKSGQPDNQRPQTTWTPPNYQSMIHTAPGGGAHGPYRIQESGGGFDVVNDNGEVKGHHETRDQAREQQKALYVNVPEAQEQAKQDEKSKSSRRKLADIPDDSSSPSGPSFTAPDSMRGNWKCSDCGAEDLGVHDLNGHAEAHRQTSHRESAIESAIDLFL